MYVHVTDKMLDIDFIIIAGLQSDQMVRWYIVRHVYLETGV
jgi:hypothetical protein